MKSLKKVLLAIILLTGVGHICTNANAAEKVIASEIVDRHLSGFHAVNVAGSFDVYIVQGAAESVKVDAPAEVMDHILTEVNDGELKIYNKNDKWNWGNWWGNHKKIVVYVSVKELSSINLSGSGDVFFKEGISSPSLKLRVTGSGDMLGKVEAKTLESSISGSGDMKLSGRAENSSINVVGSGDFAARNLLTVSTAVSVTGSGDAEVNASDKVNAIVHGSGDVRYTGAARNVSSIKTGSGDITRF